MKKRIVILVLLMLSVSFQVGNKTQSVSADVGDVIIESYATLKEVDGSFSKFHGVVHTLQTPSGVVDVQSDFLSNTSSETGDYYLNVTLEDAYKDYFVISDIICTAFQYADVVLDAGAGQSIISEKNEVTISHVNDGELYIIQSCEAVVERVSTLHITKVDDNDNDILLAGAEYILNNSTGPVATLTTESDGKVSLDGIRPGSYTIQEIVAPNGYDIDSTVYNIELQNTCATPPRPFKGNNVSNVLPTNPKIVTQSCNTLNVVLYNLKSGQSSQPTITQPEGKKELPDTGM